MMKLSLAPGAPWSVRIAADPRLTTTDYADDTTYALAAAGGPLGLFTSFGGRCQGMLWDLLWRSPTLGVAYGVEEYAATPVLRGYGPGYALLDLLPFDGLAVRAAFIAYDSHAAVCHFAITNRTSAPIDLALTGGLRLHLAAPLSEPLEPAQPLRFSVDARQETRDARQDFANGQSASGSPNPQPPIPNPQTYGAQLAIPDLRFAMLWDAPGKYESDPFPDGRGWTIWRHREVTIAPEQEESVWFALVTARGGSELQRRARSLFAVDWSDERSRHEELAAAIPVIETGDAEWDAAIACAYRMAARCYLSGNVETPDGEKNPLALPHESFVFTRGPERGFPREGEPLNHSWQWNGQVATEAYVNIPQIAPFAPDLAKAVLRNYVHIQREDGFIDWKPGLAGQREGWDCIPLLAPIARMIYDYTGDLPFLDEMFEPLVRHLDRWFAPENDRDGDGFPEWLHTIQSAFDDNPSFVPFQPWAQGADVRKAETPDLGAYLYREHMELIALAQLLQIKDQATIDRLQTRAAQLRDAVESLWNDQRAIYNYRDRDTHLSHPGGLICELATGVGEQSDLNPDDSHAVDYPRRVVVRVEAAESPDVKINLRGLDEKGNEQSEELTRNDFGWWGQVPYVVAATTAKVYRSVDTVEVAGIRGKYRVRVSFVDYTREDQTLLLPLWAGIPDHERAEALVRRTLTDPERFWRPFGIPNCAADDPAYRSDNHNGSGGVWMMWNTMLGEGLCDYGFFAEAWDLFGRIMAAQLLGLREEQCFWEAYDNDTGAGIGSRDYLWGTVPLHFLTRLHGIVVVAPDHVRLLPSDLQGRRVTVRHHGVTVTRYGSGATITWPDGRREQVSLWRGQVVERRG